MNPRLVSAGRFPAIGLVFYLDLQLPGPLSDDLKGTDRVVTDDEVEPSRRRSLGHIGCRRNRSSAGVGVEHASDLPIVPFSVAGIISSLTALAFLGFGLPETYASWGWLFDDGMNHLNALWISVSMFVAMVFVLLLVTFVGEALREAFDPKKFTTYQ